MTVMTWCWKALIWRRNGWAESSEWNFTGVSLASTNSNLYELSGCADRTQQRCWSSDIASGCRSRFWAHIEEGAMLSIRCKAFSLARSNWRNLTIIHLRDGRSERLTCVRRGSIQRLQWSRAVSAYGVGCSMDNRRDLFIVLFIILSIVLSICKISNHVTARKPFPCLVRWDFDDVETQTKILKTKGDMFSVVSSLCSCCRLEFFYRRLWSRWKSLAEHASN